MRKSVGGVWVDVVCHVGLCFSYRYGFTYWDCSQPSRECEAADSEKDLHITLSSVQNPRAEA